MSYIHLRNTLTLTYTILTKYFKLFYLHPCLKIKSRSFLKSTTLSKCLVLSFILLQFKEKLFCEEIATWLEARRQMNWRNIAQISEKALNLVFSKSYRISFENYTFKIDYRIKAKIIFRSYNFCYKYKI
jgi:hypothetical protein